MSVITNDDGTMEMSNFEKNTIQGPNGSSRDSKAKGRRVVVAISLIFSLVLFNLNNVLHINIAIQYLSLEKCYRSFQQSFTPFHLTDYVDLASFELQLPELPPEVATVTDNSTQTSLDDDTAGNSTDADSSNNGKGPLEYEKTAEGTSDDEYDDDFEPGPVIRELISAQIGPKVEKTIDDMLYLKLRDKVLKIMPRHWVKRIVDIVTFQVWISIAV